MAPNLVHLPNGQTLTVSPVFGGLFFKANELTTHAGAFPPGWTVILQSEDDGDDEATGGDDKHDGNGLPSPRKPHHPHRYRTPTLRNDALFLSSISNPSNSDFKPPTSPSRQIAMMLWATLWWYFHQVHITAGRDIPILMLKKSRIRIHIYPPVLVPRFRRQAGLKRNGVSTSRERAYSKDDICFRSSSVWD